MRRKITSKLLSKSIEQDKQTVSRARSCQQALPQSHLKHSEAVGGNQCYSDHRTSGTGSFRIIQQPGLKAEVLGLSSRALRHPQAVLANSCSFLNSSQTGLAQPLLSYKVASQEEEQQDVSKSRCSAIIH